MLSLIHSFPTFFAQERLRRSARGAAAVRGDQPVGAPRPDALRPLRAVLPEDEADQCRCLRGHHLRQVPRQVPQSALRQWPAAFR